MHGHTTPQNPAERAEPLRVALADIWPGDDEARIAALLTGQPTTLCDDLSSAEVVVCSVFGERHLAARGTLVGLSLEADEVRGAVDFSIDCRHLPRSTHLRIPPWALLMMIADDPLREPPPLDDALRRRFCNFIYSNPRCPTRNAFFEMLDRRLPVDALGSLHHNRDDARLSARRADVWRRSKIDVLRDYRFTIAFENSEVLGYTTEKMVDAWLADSVPIYWGNPAHEVDFPPGSCLSLYEAGSMTRLVDQVLEAEHDPARYAELRANNPFRTGHGQQLYARFQTELTDFAELIRAEALQRRTHPSPGPIANARHSARVARRRLVRRVRKLLAS